jgi:hypothetical protein
MNVQNNPILIGIIAGLAAAILVVMSNYVSPVFVILAIVILFIAGLGFGRLSGLVAVATAAIALGAVTASIPQALISAVILLPAAVMSHLASLGRPATEIGGPEATTAWYPLSDILLAGAMLTALVSMCLIILTPVEVLELSYQKGVDDFAQMVVSFDPAIVITDAAKQEYLKTMRAIGPIVQAGLYMLMLFAGFYFAMRILTAVGLNIRPREDIRSSLRMNRLSIGIFLCSIVLMFAGGTLALIGKSFMGAIAVCFLLAGYAALHEILRQKSWGIFALVAIYIATFFFLPLMLAIAIAGGLANPRRAVALTPDKPNQTSSNQT